MGRQAWLVSTETARDQNVAVVLGRDQNRSRIA